MRVYIGKYSQYQSKILLIAEGDLSVITPQFVWMCNSCREFLILHSFSARQCWGQLTELDGPHMGLQKPTSLRFSGSWILNTHRLLSSSQLEVNSLKFSLTNILTSYHNSDFRTVWHSSEALRLFIQSFNYIPTPSTSSKLYLENSGCFHQAKLTECS